MAYVACFIAVLIPVYGDQSVANYTNFYMRPHIDRDGNRPGAGVVFAY
jgi:hypothetical protein